MKRLTNKVAIITGAASGMGETTARVFAREGATVIITDVQEQAIKDLVADIQGEYGDVALGIVHDIADEQSWTKVTQEVVAKFGKIDILVNNAAIGGKDWKYEDASLEEWQKVMKVNAEGAFWGFVPLCLI
ncbi:Cyclopentanol dehydrogenase [Moraxella lacunata]|jgi:short-chain dehydrogenase/reductase SDR|uniref:Cyclopentanol dehydrogenase n=1 Tax=Moraxella lacunata TaxID=477 RepID=A0A378QJ12_MORLA|nr:SDR family NAD(P)-dependent oxidoreductase [Moraxella lacunata]STZ00472.1 Cyclopentanol dehydrogenase [Moraxella lacunata]